MYRTLKNNFEDKKSLFGSNPEVFCELFNEKIKELITYQTPNKYLINYHGKNLLHHSLGQRASALIIFILTRGGHDLIMIDQPEDDLDNQTIYEDVIKLIREIKPQVQFILATHNPNIPVLADAELVQVCSFINEKIEVSSGSIDEPDIQKQIINIMEGGKEAFERRKEIYKKWINKIDNLYVTYIEKNYTCNVFFPNYKEHFILNNVIKEDYSEQEGCYIKYTHFIPKT
jgi:hypothetical protein